MDTLYGTAAEWQSLISKLNGVYAAHVVFSDAQEPQEIHVLASSRRNGKSLVRDVQSAITARYGIEVDYRIISVAQIAPSVITSYSIHYTKLYEKLCHTWVVRFLMPDQQAAADQRQRLD